MPSHLHEALIELFRRRPSLAAELLRDALGVPIPGFQHARVDSEDLTNLTPTEYRADAVVTFTADTHIVLAVVVEVQLHRDRGKRRSWPVYLTTLHARLRCPVILLVLCPNPTTAQWCSRSIPLGHPGFALRPLVLGPQRVPVVTDYEVASRAPELAVLSAIAHGSHPAHEKVLHAFLAALSSVDHERANLYADVVLSALPAAARHHLEALMTIGTYEYQSDFARRYFSEGEAKGEAKGKAKGEAKALLAVLAARGIDVPATAHARITECTDPTLLETWVVRAATAGSIDDVLD